MASTYPFNIDNFPTHVDDTEYMTAADLNNVQNSIVAIQTVLGAGPRGQAGNPLYSPTLGVTYSTLADRLQTIETAAAASLGLDFAPGDVTTLAFGQTSSVGSSSLASPAGHAHGLPAFGTTIQPVGQSPNAGSSGHPADSLHIHQGVTQLTAGTGISVTGGDGSGHGALSVANTGVTQLNAGYGLNVTGGDGSGHGALSAAVSLNTLTSFLSANLPSSGASSENIVSIVLPSGTWLLFFHFAMTATSSGGSAAIAWLTNQSQGVESTQIGSGIGAPIPNTSVTGFGEVVSNTGVAVVSGPGTFYLCGHAGAGAATWASGISSDPFILNATGITALRIG
jgi:hypothetical protein